MIRSLVLFAHIAGMLLLFAGLALELARIEVRRLYGVASAIILLSGAYLAARVGVHAFAWVRLSFVAMVLMAIAGAPAVRSRLGAFSLRFRIALGLGVVYLMISKAAAPVSIAVLGLAVLAALAAGALTPRRNAPSTSGAPQW